jgi:hypothetical protein
MIDTRDTFHASNFGMGRQIAHATIKAYGIEEAQRLAELALPQAAGRDSRQASAGQPTRIIGISRVRVGRL